MEEVQKYIELNRITSNIIISLVGNIITYKNGTLIKKGLHSIEASIQYLLDQKYIVNVQKLNN